MLKKTITYTDYNGVERKEDFYFNMSKAELVEMELDTNGGFENTIKKIIEAEDSKSMVKIIKDLILKAYGKKSDDGKRFIKSKELSDEFSQTEAYSELFMELALSDQAAANFINGIIPSDISKKIENALN